MFALTLVLAAAFTCPAPKVFALRAGGPWTDQDQAALTQAVQTCAVRYGGCLSRFCRDAPGQYYAICRKAELAERGDTIPVDDESYHPCKNYAAEP